jgi:NRPS condensation-like uncharacterized protein
MIAKDSEAYPCDIWVRMRLTGEFDQSLFQECWREMLGMHPLLKCRLERKATGHRWIESQQLPAIEWIVASPTETNTSFNEPIWPEPKEFDPYGGCLTFPFVVDYRNGSYDFFLQIHHVVCDGLGILDALEDLWTLYDRAVNGTVHKRLDRFCEVDCQQRLVSRNRFGLNVTKLVRLIPKQIVGLQGVRQFLMRAPVPLVSHEMPKSVPTRVSSMETDLSETLFESIRTFAKQHAVTVNECLAAAIFDGVAAFRRERKQGQVNEWIRMMVPMDMRTSDDKKNLTACNVVSSVFLDRQPKQISDFVGNLKSVNKEMNLIKENKLAFMFLFSIWLRRLTRFGRHGSAVVKRCETTVVFTNLGRVFPRTKLTKQTQGLQSGKVLLTEFSILAPLNPLTVLAISFCEFASVPKLQIRYCNRVLTTDDAKSIMKKILGRLEHLQK